MTGERVMRLPIVNEDISIDTAFVFISWASIPLLLYIASLCSSLRHYLAISQESAPLLAWIPMNPGWLSVALSMIWIGAPVLILFVNLIFSQRVTPVFVAPVFVATVYCGYQILRTRRMYLKNCYAFPNKPNKLGNN